MTTTQDPPPLLSVIAVTWNAKRYVDSCLRSLEDVEKIPLEIIVVDNASADGTPDLIAREFKNFKLIRNDRNLGFSRANNIGIRASRGRFICLVNSDVVVPRGCFSTLLKYMELNPDVGMVGPQMIAPDGNVGRSTMRFPSLRSSIGRAVGLGQFSFTSHLLNSQLVPDFAHDKTADVEVLNGWFWMVRRDALGQVGLLDEQFFIYGEDLDWCRRFRKAGWRLVFHSDAHAVHHGGGSSSAAPVRFYIEQQRADFQYWNKHHSVFVCLFHRGIVFLHNLVRLIGYWAVYVIDNGRKSEALAKVHRSWTLLVWMTGARVRI